ncbi:hypothetical protein D9619_004345 [Psilocybe cf. subviscida]|uniref:BTB domain-containing protein n=1 Tax=Psilocybe cf. subviscida TaxID=2480587 RepID=A0A8H5BQL9_9AGAR|nr:hypothetical protein D9619_004345 [Psilocybe cf. subviscida]
MSPHCSPPTPDYDDSLTLDRTPYLDDATSMLASFSNLTVANARHSIAFSSADIGTPTLDYLTSRPTSSIQSQQQNATLQPSYYAQDKEPVSTRHPRFWMYDGSIVLRAENTLYRVHQTVLAAHSDIFDGLFTVPQPQVSPPIDGNSPPFVDGCHVVTLYGDKERDVEDLLHAVYVPDHFSHLAPDADLETLLDFITGILRLATKYMIRHLRQRCIALLHTKFPCTFEGYDSKAATSSDRYRSDMVMRTISIAQELNVPTVLPYAYYCMSRFPHRRFLKERPGDISWQTKTIVLIGRERLALAQASITHAFLLVFRRSPLCVSALCAHARGPHAQWHELENARCAHPLRRYDAWHDLNVCRECVSYCQNVHDLGRRDVWKHLPEWFELGDWDELKETQDR